MDFFKVALQYGSTTVAHMIDVASKYQAARVVHGETTVDAIHALGARVDPQLWKPEALAG